MLRPQLSVLEPILGRSRGRMVRHVLNIVLNLSFQLETSALLTLVFTSFISGALGGGMETLGGKYGEW